MAGLVKKISLFVFILSVLCLSSCGNSRAFVYHSPIIRENAEQMFQCIIDRDAEGLLAFFSAEMQENESEKTLEEIEKLFEFIDGDIASYSYHLGGGKGSINNLEYDYYLCHPTFQSVETTTGKIYTIRFTYNYIWKDKPEQEGLSRIRVFYEKGSDKEAIVGKLYDTPF